MAETQRQALLLRRSLKAVQQRKRREEARLAGSVPEPTPWLSAMLLLIFFWSAWDVSLPTIYWQKQREVQGQPPLPQEAMQRKVEDLFLRCDVSALAALADPERTPVYLVSHPAATGKKAAALQRRRAHCRAAARSFLAKMRLRGWVGRANAERGLAPTTRLLVERFNNERVQHAADAVLPELRDPATDAYARVWAHRWRSFVGCAFSKIRVQDHIDMEEKRGKAGGVTFFP